MRFKVGDRVKVTSVTGELLEGMDDFLGLTGIVKEVDTRDQTVFVSFETWSYYVNECDLSLENEDEN